MKIDEVSELMKRNNISPSVQRISIYKYMIDNKNHPTVDMIYKALEKKIPTLSKTTVYNTLNLFIEKGIVIEIKIDKNEMRYDADVSIHGHFLSEKTGEIHDFDVDISELNPEFLKKQR